MSIVLGKKELIELLKEKYPSAEEIQLYIDYNDEGVEGNDQIIAEIYLPDEQLPVDGLIGFFDEPNKDGKFVLDIESAREERIKEILEKYQTSK